MLTDIEIAQQARFEDLYSIARRSSIPADALIPYGRNKAKLDLSLLPKEQKAKLILVTATNPTPAGEGKTTTSIGLADALTKLGKKSMLALREPSLGPVFGVKGGAAGGGYAQVIPMEDINLHFTGDFHAITSANNLCAALLDNHIKQGNNLQIDPRRIVIRRCLDMNDRQLRHIVDGLGGPANGVVREDGFDISVASEVMAAFCMADDIFDLKRRLAEMVVAYTYEQKPVRAGDLKAEGAMCALLKDAMLPNLVQTLEHTPAIIHGGPFANIAHGCNSVAATKAALSLADFVVTEAGFGADLGAEKFLDLKCRAANLEPDAVVLVSTIRALKYNGGLKKDELGAENLEALKAGLPNLVQHLENLQGVYGLPVVVALNRFPTDTEAELALVKDEISKLGAKVCVSEVWAKGSEGGLELAEAVLEATEKEKNFRFAYELDASLEEKIEAVATKIYHADGVQFSAKAQRQLKTLAEQGFDKLGICVAKTQYSFSDDPTRLAAPKGFTLQIRELKVSAAAGFVVVLTGDIMTMPGLPKHPAAEQIDIDEQGNIVGLF